MRGYVEDPPKYDPLKPHEQNDLLRWEWELKSWTRLIEIAYEDLESRQNSFYESEEDIEDVINERVEAEVNRQLENINSLNDDFKDASKDLAKDRYKVSELLKKLQAKMKELNRDPKKLYNKAIEKEEQNRQELEEIKRAHASLDSKIKKLETKEREFAEETARKSQELLDKSIEVDNRSKKVRDLIDSAKLIVEDISRREAALDSDASSIEEHHRRVIET